MTTKARNGESTEKIGPQRDRGFSWYVRELHSERCLCGARKQSRKSFCYRCYILLPQFLQEQLYSRLGQGYEEAFEAAEEWLEEHVW